jgi:hypothetical protein
MTTVAKLNPMSNVPKLEVDGTNWVMFSTCLRIALMDKDIYGHLDGTSAKPDQTTDLDNYAAWLKKENQALNLLTQKLHDTTLTKVLSLNSAAKWWTVITHEFTVKSSHIVAAMRTSFNKMKCTDNGNIRTHLDKLRAKYEDLICVGVTVPQDQWATRIIGSLPEHYQKHLATIEAAARAAAQRNQQLARHLLPPFLSHLTSLYLLPLKNTTASSQVALTEKRRKMLGILSLWLQLGWHDTLQC